MTIAIVPVEVIVLDVAPEATEMAIVSTAPGSGVDVDADNVVTEETVEAEGRMVRVIVLVEGA